MYHLVALSPKIDQEALCGCHPSPYVVRNSQATTRKYVDGSSRPVEDIRL